ncbi:hypothetical protein IFO69_10455 [Echinicola sp. CAU 1574]|uniref:Lipocalin-like protein n=1 Tax=Echinicola arenosa TaxID=2774144 RepID=A0ABR9AK72_9BACT|nr:hypothetical protein [Echinicola arenosa]MBD8489166.1 hypothetical protein [Echinicola arenosa]
MKLPFSFSFFCLMALLASCKSDDEIVPTPENINGTYERTIYSGEKDIWYAYSLVFTVSGEVEQAITIRETENGEDEGYFSLVMGKYSLQGANLTWELEEFYDWVSSDPNEPYGPREQMVLQEEANPIQQSGTLKLLDGGNTLSIEFPCNDVMSNCVGELIYHKVD